MEKNTIKIKCPNCGGKLVVKLKTSNQDINIPCPICKISSPFKSYTQITDSITPDYTEYPKHEEDTTQIGIHVNHTLGILKIQGSTTHPFSLKIGRNIIGRKAKTSTADIQIPLEMMERNLMSREHLIIDVNKVPGKGIVHHLSLYKSNVNKTFLNHEILDSCDRIILKHGDIITLPDIKLVFEIPNEEGTII